VLVVAGIKAVVTDTAKAPSASVLAGIPAMHHRTRSCLSAESAGESHLSSRRTELCRPGTSYVAARGLVACRAIGSGNQADEQPGNLDRRPLDLA